MKKISRNITHAVRLPKFLYVSLLLLALLFILFGSKNKNRLYKSTNTFAQVQNNSKAKKVEEEYVKRINMLKRLAPLLAQRSLPFSIEVLAKDNWRERLRPHLEKMPEMAKTSTFSPGGYLSGIYIADTIILPEKVVARGITFILTRNIVFEGSSSIITGENVGEEGGIFIFPVESDNWHRVKIGRSNGSKERRISQTIKFKELDGLKSTFAPTRDETNLLASLEIPSNAKNVHLRGSYAYFQGGEIVVDTSAKGKGAKGAEALIPPPQPGFDTSPPKAPDGVCTPGNENGLNGANGDNGLPGANTGASGRGQKGPSASPLFYSIPYNNPAGAYYFTAIGGEGGDGGDGKIGGQGGQGQQGATGGKGANCCHLNPSYRGNGGKGGPGGRGGPGGSGGTAGEGGEGGDGKDIVASYPSNYDSNAIHTNANAGPDGNPGASSPGGPGGLAGLGGLAGETADGVCGSSVSLGPGNTLGMGGTGNTGGAGPPASTHGKSGEVSISPYSPDISCNYCVATSDCILNECGNSTQCLTSQSICGDGSPIILDVRGDWFSMTDAANGVIFDLSGEGSPQWWSWTSSASDDAWLALDRNGNGLIDNGQELFGNLTPQPPTTDDPNGFIALAQYDKLINSGNNDGIIDSQDYIFPKLLLWRDTNHNGVSEAAEISAFSTTFGAISLDYAKSRATDQYGNRFKYKSQVRGIYNQRLGWRAWDVFLVGNR